MTSGAIFEMLLRVARVRQGEKERPFSRAAFRVVICKRPMNPPERLRFRWGEGGSGIGTPRRCARQEVPRTASHVAIWFLTVCVVRHLAESTYWVLHEERTVPRANQGLTG
jgi:hypothetical protein